MTKNSYLYLNLNFSLVNPNNKLHMLTRLPSFIYIHIIKHTIKLEQG